MSGPVIEAQRLRLIRLAQAEGLPVRTVLKLARGELDMLDGYPEATVLAYARALLCTAERRVGHVPMAWSEAAHCDGCGPVWLWSDLPPRVLACPWCWNRLAGLPVPRPPPHTFCQFTANSSRRNDGRKHVQD